MQKSLQGWFPTRDFFFLKPRAGCYSAQAQRTIKGACLWWPFLSAWLPIWSICTLHLWPDLAFQTLQAKHPEKSLLVWPVLKRMACSMRELVEPLLPTSRWRTHRPSFIILLFLGKCVLQLGARRKYAQKSSRKPTILQLKGTNCTYLLALSARLLALAAFSLTPLNPVSCVFHQRTREQRFVVCFPLWLCRLFEFNCQAGRCSLFLFFLWCGNQTAVACNMLGELLWLEQTPSCIGIGQCLGGNLQDKLKRWKNIAGAMHHLRTWTSESIQKQ